MEKLLTKTPVFLNDWSSNDDVARDFQTSLADVNILFASYGYSNYSGDAFVLFENEGKLFEVNGSHCSCYGLEGQWSPEETNLAALRHRLYVGGMGTDNYSDNQYSEELKKFLFE